MGTTIDATRSAEPIGFTFNDDDVWYKFNTGDSGAPLGVSIRIIFDDRTGFGLGLYDDCGGTLLGANSTALCEDEFPIREALKPNTTYYIRAWSAFRGQEFAGDFQIAVYKNGQRKIVFNDICRLAKELPVNQGSCHQFVTFDSDGATDSRFDFQAAPFPNTGDRTDLDYLGRDVWYTLRFPSSGDLLLSGLLADFNCAYNVVFNVC